MIFFLMQIIPVLYLAWYDHPTSDDFQYGAASHQVWIHTGSVWAVIKAAAQGVASDYQKWQGSYAALFLMRLEPTVFGERCYAAVPYLMIGLLTCSSLYLMRTVFHHLLKSNSLHWVSTALLLVMMSIQFSPVASEQFFWYNSAVYYNAGHAFMLFYLAWLICYFITGKKRYPVYLGIFGVIIGGGNYISALTTLLLLATGIALQILKKGPRRRQITGVLLSAELLAAFLISAAAPGNAVRAGTVAGYGAVSSVLHSLQQGTNYYVAWLDKWWLLVICFLLPLMIRLIRETNFRFRYPVLVLLYSYGIFCAMSCPTFYALGSTGPGRIINIIYDAFLWITLFQVFYVLGWLIRKMEKQTESKKQITDYQGLSRINSGLVVMLLMLLLVSGSFLDTTTITACKVWLKGEGKQYDTEYMQRLSVMENQSVSNVVFHAYSVKPALVFIADGTEDPDFVNNQEWAGFYGKKSLTILSDTDVATGK